VQAPSHCLVGGCHLPTRSALAVPPGFDGLLRAMGRRLVASCSRPWGSRRFRAILTGPGTPDAAGRSPLPSRARAGQRLAPVAAARCPRTPGISSVRTPALPRGAPPFGGFPSLAAVPPRARCRDTVHPWPLPPRRSSPSLPQLRRIRRCRGAGFSLASSTSRPCSARESVAPMNVAAQLRPILPWAWSSCQMPEVTATGPHRGGAPAATGRHMRLGLPCCLRLRWTSRPWLLPPKRSLLQPCP
jgi:hypothetical protein